MNQTVSVLLVVALTTVAVSAAGPEAKYKAPRTEDGRPDLRGVWNFNSGVPLQRPAAFAGRKYLTREEFDKQRATLQNALASAAKFAPVENVGADWIDNALHVDDLRTSLITYPEDGRLPALVEGVRRTPSIEDIIAALTDAKSGSSTALLGLLAAFAGGKKDSHLDFNKYERCLVVAEAPLLPQFSDNYVQIIQARDHVALRTDGTMRIVALDGKPHVGEKLRSWSGTSRGHWEGETLVVKTRNFNTRTESLAGAGNSRDKVVTERFSRTSKGVLEYAATVVDSTTFQDRIELAFPMALVDARLFESACHEGNYSLTNTLSVVRKEEAAKQTE
jgi:hypothetical protein